MALLQHLGSENRPGDAVLVRRIAGMKDSIADTLAANTAPHPDESPIHSGDVMEAMIDVLDDDAIIASDVGSCQIWGALSSTHRDASFFRAIGCLECNELRPADRCGIWR
jgi:thiamine pyrophosphate-dependent acetolactate synthase large subunit-like protein